MAVRSLFSGHYIRRRGFWFFGLVGLGVVVALAIAFNSQEVAIATALSWQAWLAIAVTIAAFLGNAFTTLPADIVFLGAAAVLLLSGVLDEESALAGFSNSGVITVGVLYIVVAGLQQTGALQWVSQQVLGMPRTPSRALIRLMLPVMGASAFLNNTPVVAMFIPVVNDWCRKLRFSPSKLMIPLSYAAIFGGLCSLIGTSTNLVVNGLLIDAGGEGLKLFDIAWVGLPCAVAGFLFLFIGQAWLLPDRQAAITSTDDLREYMVDMVVVPNSPLVGKTVEKAGLRHLPNLYLAEIDRNAQVLSTVGPHTQLESGDQLRFVGVVDSILDLQRIKGLQPATDEVFKLDGPRKERISIEAVVSNTCPIVGQTIRESRFRTQYNAVVVAAARNGDRLIGKIGDIRIQPGDTLLLEASADFINRRRVSRDFYLVSSLPNSEPIRHERSRIALALTVVMVVVAAFGWLSMLQAAILAAVGVVAFGCCSPSQALRSIDWSVLMVIAAALALGQALDSTGAAEAIATRFIALAGNNPLLVLAAIYTITTILTEVITNNAAAALIFPIALSLANQLGASALPFVISIMVAASASFATPIGYQTNLMVCGPGGYRFSDFMRIGIPLNILYGAITVAIAPLIYPF